MIKTILPSLICSLAITFLLPVFSHEINTEDEKSYVRYALSCFNIPFKIKKLPASAVLNISKGKEDGDLYLNNVSFKAAFTSKNPFFRKLVSYDKYPGIYFKSSLKKPLHISSNKPFDISGKLSFHGVTRKIRLKMINKSDNNDIEFIGYLKIEMDDFGINPPLLASSLIDNVIKTKINICAYSN